MLDRTIKTPSCDSHAKWKYEMKGAVNELALNFELRCGGNPLLALHTWAHGSSMEPHVRGTACYAFAYAVPTEEAIAKIVGLGPVVEIGAGTGYWARLIANAGGDVVAYDKPIKGRQYVERIGRYHHVHKGGLEMTRHHENRTLLMCWPDFFWEAYDGNTIVYIGEGEGGCCAGEDFFNEMSYAWNLIETIPIPQWDGIHDYMFVYRRK